jgi:hypothetical protein
VSHTYVASPRHKQPWQPGARGTLCPAGVDGVELFRTATANPNNPRKRYNTDGEQAYCAHPSVKNLDDDEQDVMWHGFPIEWRAVPPAVQRIWIEEGRITKLRMRG